MTYMEGMVYKKVDKEINKEADKEVNKEVDEYEAYAVNKVDKEVNKVVDEYETIHPKKDFCCGDGYFGQKKFAEKVRKSRQNVNCDKSA